MDDDVNDMIYVGVIKENNEIVEDTVTKCYYDMDELVADIVSNIKDIPDGGCENLRDCENFGVCEMRIGGVEDEEDNEFVEDIINEFIEKVEDSNVQVERKKFVHLKVLIDISEGIKDDLLKDSELKEANDLLKIKKDENSPFSYEINRFGTKFIFASFKTVDGDKRFEEIKNKDILTKKDIGDLSLLHLMNSKDSIEEVFLKVCKFTNTLDLEKKDIEYLKANQYMNSIKFITDDEILDTVLKEINIEEIFKDWDDSDYSDDYRWF